jgi:hypothetical protein
MADSNETLDTGFSRRHAGLPKPGGLRQYSPEYQAEYTRLYKMGFRGPRLREAMEEFEENEEFAEGWLPGEPRRRRVRKGGAIRRSRYNCPCCDSKRKGRRNDSDEWVQGLSKAEISALATKVYDLLRDELRIEAERHGVDYFARRAAA